MKLLEAVFTEETGALRRQVVVFRHPLDHLMVTHGTQSMLHFVFVDENGVVAPVGVVSRWIVEPTSETIQ